MGIFLFPVQILPSTLPAIRGGRGRGGETGVCISKSVGNSAAALSLSSSPVVRKWGIFLFPVQILPATLPAIREEGRRLVSVFLSLWAIHLQPLALAVARWSEVGHLLTGHLFVSSPDTTCHPACY
jgi:hypothetical protein